jgi:hypothetical protein
MEETHYNQFEKLQTGEFTENDKLFQRHNIFHPIKLIFNGKVEYYKIIIFIVTITLVSNINAITDYYLHPEIPYFDDEHLIVGSITGIFCLAFGVVVLYIDWLKNINNERNIFLKELSKEKEKRKKVKKIGKTLLMLSTILFWYYRQLIK